MAAFLFATQFRLVVLAALNRNLSFRSMFNRIRIRIPNAQSLLGFFLSLEFICSQLALRLVIVRI